MTPRFYSLSWPNIDPEILHLQRQVFDHLGIPLDQHVIPDFEHGDWITWVLNRSQDQAWLGIVDADAIALSPHRVHHLTRQVGGPDPVTLAGAAGRAHHIGPRSYVHPQMMVISPAAWRRAGSPTAAASPSFDAAQNLTDRWHQLGWPTWLQAPTRSCARRWSLSDGTPFGPGTEYADLCWHLWQGRDAAPDAVQALRWVAAVRLACPAHQPWDSGWLDPMYQTAASGP